MCTAVLAGLVVSGASGQESATINAAGAKAAEVLLQGATYDVATIKPSDPNAMGGSAGAWPNGRFSSKNQPMKNAICSAYGVLTYQCVGGPAWLESDRYDIEAKPGSATAEQLLKLTWKERGSVTRASKEATPPKTSATTGAMMRCVNPESSVFAISKACGSVHPLRLNSDHVDTYSGLGGTRRN